MLALLVPGVGMGGGQAAVQVEVPDVVGETQATGTTELETALFVVAVETAYSPSVAVGLIISQDPIGGSFASEGSTVTITVSLGPEPVATNLGGDDAPPRKQKDYRPELDEKRLSEQRELRQALERAAGLIEEAVETAADTGSEPLKQQAEAAGIELKKLRAYAEALTAPKVDLEAAQRRVDEIIARSVDQLIVQIADVLTDLIQEIAEDSKS